MMKAVAAETRDAMIEGLYQQLGTLVRRSHERSEELHPGLTVVAYTLLVEIGADPDVRAADLAAHFGLDKSTVSRQLAPLEAAGQVVRGPERPGRRGYTLTLTAAGRRSLATASRLVQARLAQWLGDWPEADIAELARLLTRFNQSRT